MSNLKNQFEMKNLSVIILGAFALVFILFACQNKATKNVNDSSCSESIVSKISIDSLQGEFVPVPLDWNEVVLALFISDEQTCELLVGYRVPKYSAIATFAHRKIVVVGANGCWNRKMQTVFVTSDGRNMKLVPAYPPNSVSPMPNKPFKDKPLKTSEQVPLR